MEELLKASHISKFFPGVRALQDVNITVNSGEILGLLGENGAGKSTLLNVLSGIYQPDEGEIRVRGQSVKMQGVNDAFELGIAIVHQELKLHSNMSVAENIYMGRLPKNRLGTVQYKKLYQQVEELLSAYGLKLNPHKEVRLLSIAEQQLTEIAKVLSYNAKVILMDEPTSSLTTEETQNLFRTMEVLKKKGVGIVFISHKLEEIAECCDRVQVLRDGQDMGEKPVKEVSENELIRMMVGREISQRFPAKTNSPGEPLLEVRNLNRGKYVKDVSFTVRRGEVFGIAGLVGAGRSELVRLIFGADKKDSGEILMNGQKIDIKSPRDAIRNGIYLVPEDRKKQGLILAQDVENNTVLSMIYKIRKAFGYIDTPKEKVMADEQIEALHIKCTGKEQITGTLSGGNQQKVVIGKCMLTNPEVMILDDPTRGIDIGTKAEIYELINEVTNSGRSVILISSEMPEVIKMSDRVAVMHEGRITGILEHDELTQEQVIKYAIGG
ncbi:sugar ABC transporter ATP-binding protein [Diplocloster agilis]|uniref:sugar ABC transporter ATP-binding protein n=1 Tax=Diplocloster agilis TaxID=2850323 RepID=UPI0008229C36|nr:sugar ABC transporter ATP-binding protein [Suonthocola fibrivorans]MCU6736385.1 sugar ABC transporter ATP-binding protein [Suonthocola fibrivorans]SCJ89920.1 Ribose import ATP-binding protein RbsA [uncultured Clostridium sp.]